MPQIKNKNIESVVVNLQKQIAILQKQVTSLREREGKFVLKISRASCYPQALSKKRQNEILGNLTFLKAS